MKQSEIEQIPYYETFRMYLRHGSCRVTQTLMHKEMARYMHNLAMRDQDFSLITLHKSQANQYEQMFIVHGNFESIPSLASLGSPTEMRFIRVQTGMTLPTLKPCTAIDVEDLSTLCEMPVSVRFPSDYASSLPLLLCYQLCNIYGVLRGQFVPTAMNYFLISDIELSDATAVSVKAHIGTAAHPLPIEPESEHVRQYWDRAPDTYDMRLVDERRNPRDLVRERDSQ